MFRSLGNFAAAALLVLLMPVVAVAAEAAGAFTQGVHYEKLEVPVQTENDDGVEVVEVFSYACVHCKNFDPTLEAWRETLPDNVTFRRVPAVFDQTWALFAQAFYTAEVLGVTDKVHTPMFLAIHEQGVDLRDPTLLAALFEQAADVPPAEFTQVFNSFGVRSRVQQAEARGRAYGITGVPALIVDGRYRVDGRMAGNNTNMLAVVDYLVAEILAQESAADTAGP
jgi:thiol:disulfide interchange protein DsbA